jgi:hypothetical protein
VAIITHPPHYEAVQAAAQTKSIPSQTTQFFVEQARNDLAQYNDSAPGARSTIKAKMRELIEELDNSLHKENMSVADQDIILGIGELISHQVRWKNQHKTWH